MSQRREVTGAGAASASASPSPAAAVRPASIAARLAGSCSAPFFSDWATTAFTLSAGIPRSPAANPSTTMFGQLPGIAFAICFSGSLTARAPVFVYTSGASPWSGSPTIRLAPSNGTSSAKR